MSKLEFISLVNTPFSFLPSKSDYTVNQVLLDPLVGTLVKYGKNGMISPYLAESWSHNADKTEWVFSFRKDLLCEDGTIIDPQSYKETLEFLLKQYSKNDKVMSFENLIGFSNFRRGIEGHIKGLQVVNESLKFVFSKPAVELLNYLRMPYFGFYCKENFDSDGKWISDTIISSSGYRVIKKSLDSVLVEKRVDWPFVKEESPNRVVFKKETSPHFDRKAAQIFYLGSKVIEHEELFHSVQGIPTILVALSINSNSLLFSNKKNRQIFVKAISEEKENLTIKSANINVSKSFYPGEISEIKYTNELDYDFDNVITVSVPKVPLPRHEFSQLVGSVKKSLGKFCKNIEVVDSPSDADIQILAVDIGDSIKKEPIEMMFCSNMGVGFPDPGGVICELLNRWESSRIDKKEFVSLFNQALVDDALVIPFYHLSLGWLYSKKIDPDTISLIPNYPRFEDLRLK